ncbi:MAG: competence protein ComEA [Xanthomonadales bacterium]|jgi:competence protein ComEA|nr:competence protein ComEA [Xanthomonadales bacterium]
MSGLGRFFRISSQSHSNGVFPKAGKMRSLLFTLFAVLLFNTAQAGAVNINKADAPTISRELDGVSRPLAQRIVQHRRDHGPFRSAQDLSRVPYVGDALIERNRANILFE